MTENRKPKPRLLVLTQVHQPEPNFITADVAAAMTADYDVVVVTSHPNYPYGKFYPGVFPWLPRKTIEQGVVVWRLPCYPYHGRSQIKRALSYVTYALAALLFAPFVAGRPALVWVYHGPFTAGPAAIPFKVFYGSRVVFTCADLWPETFLAAGVADSGFVIRMLFAYRRAVNRIADVLICTTRGTLKRFIEDGVDPARLHFVPVWVGGIRDCREAMPSSGGVPRIVYAGNLGPAQSLETAILAAAELKRRGVDVVFDLYGSGNWEHTLKELAQNQGASNVCFHGRVEAAKAFHASSRAFAQIISLQPSPLFDMTIPSKLSFCCAAGAPVLFGLRGEAAAMMRESGGGIPFEADNPHSLVEAVTELLKMSDTERTRMHHALRQYYVNLFEPTTLLAKYRALFASESAGGVPGGSMMARTE